MSAIVECERLGKRYQLRHESDRERYVALRDVIAAAVKAPFTRQADRSAPSREDFWALRDVSFQIAAGEVVGIIGRNGAGKSTLLKVLSRITDPTEGRVTLHGRVASLLEVGTGFHPELTGRENIFLNGAILGMTRAEIIRKFDEIVAFAEVERFLDTPVKRYSSGMYVRLAFAVAAHLEPEILIVDEVLAVGDAEFQKKCLGKMQVVSQSGRTVLFVSHNMAAVQALCGRAVWLDRGQIGFDGLTDECVSHYLAATLDASPRVPSGPVAIGAGLALVESEVSPNPVPSGGRVEFRLRFAATSPTRINELTLLVYSESDVRVAIVDLRTPQFPVALGAGETWQVSGWIERMSLVEGDYQIGFGIGTQNVWTSRIDIADLRVTPSAKPGQLAPHLPQYRGYVELEAHLHG